MVAPVIRNLPTQIDWEIYAGDNCSKDFRVTAGGVPVDLTGATVESQARVKASDPVVALTADVEVVDAVQGIFRVIWDGEDVRVLLAGAEKWKGVWDVQVAPLGGGLPVTRVKGLLIAYHDVTRA